MKPSALSCKTRFRVAAAVVLLALLILPSSCMVQTLSRQLILPSEMETLDRASPYLKAHMKDGSVYVLSEWTIGEADSTVQESGKRLDANREEIRSGSFTIPIDSVAIFETNRTQVAPAVIGLTVVTMASVAVTAYCLANPKACFGSCPTFYAWDGERMLLQAEGFSSSVSPSLEATDIDALYRVKPPGREVGVRMTNEALETHVVRSVRLLVAQRPPDGRVLATPSGEFWQATAFQEPISCVGEEGDFLAAVQQFDGAERFSKADSVDLASREQIDLTFSSAPGNRAGLVIASRQTLLSTYLFYQTLAYMGEDAGSWFAALERGGESFHERAMGIWEALGGIEVLIPDEEDRWTRVAQVSETGPLATDLRVIPLPRLPEGPVRIRLRLTRGLWRLDYIALARLEAPTLPVAIEAEKVLRDGIVDQEARERLTDPSRTLTTLPGDAYTMTFRLPQDPDRLEIFLESRGYYLEWMREEWLPERNPELAMTVFLDPRRILRTLAPEFKKVESGMEDAFWRSRYVRP